MITKLILSSFLAVILSSGLFQKNHTSYENGSEVTEHVVRAIQHNGEIMPYYNLPVVEITAKINTDVLVKAAIIDGEVVPMIELQEIIVTPNSGMNSI